MKPSSLFLGLLFFLGLSHSDCDKSRKIKQALIKSLEVLDSNVSVKYKDKCLKELEYSCVDYIRYCKKHTDYCPELVVDIDKSYFELLKKLPKLHYDTTASFNAEIFF